MRIRVALLEEIVAHARDCAPDECCGLIGGNGDLAMGVYRADNARPSPLSFELSNFGELVTAMADNGHELIGVYHSHTRSEAVPSGTDVEGMRRWPELVHVICSLLDRDAPVVQAWELGAPQAVELITDG